MYPPAQVTNWKEAPRSQMKEEYRPFGRLAISIWPLKEALIKWQKKNPRTHLRFAMGQIVKSGNYDSAINSTIERISILGSGSSKFEAPTNELELISWWSHSSG